MKKYLRRILIVLSAVAFMGLLFSGCQATKGLGKDVENLGENIQGD